jgi:protein-tyrosine phosphatase
MRGMTRKHPFEGVQNFRDFGGYDTSKGQQMARGRFFRSAHHGMATDADLQKMAEFGLETVIDLRRPSERERQPSKRWANFAATVLQNEDEKEAHEQWADFIMRPNITAQSFRDYLTQYYREIPWGDRHRDLYTRYFDALANTTGPVLVHCSGGKDRTGMLCAFTQELAGVHRDDIFEDYLMTNDLERFERDGPMFATYLSEMRGDGIKVDNEIIRLVLGVEAPFLEATYEEIKKRHGDVETYVRDVLGVDKAKRDKIEKRLFD